MPLYMGVSHSENMVVGWSYFCVIVFFLSSSSLPLLDTPKKNTNTTTRATPLHLP